MIWTILFWLAISWPSCGIIALGICMLLEKLDGYSVFKGWKDIRWVVALLALGWISLAIGIYALYDEKFRPWWEGRYE